MKQFSILIAFMAFGFSAVAQFKLTINETGRQLSGTWKRTEDKSYMPDTIIFAEDRAVMDTIPFQSRYMEEARKKLAQVQLIFAGYMTRHTEGKMDMHPFILIQAPDEKYLHIIWFRHLRKGAWDVVPPGENEDDILARWGNGESYTCYFAADGNTVELYLGGDTGKGPFTKYIRR